MHYYVRYRGGLNADDEPVERGHDQHPQLLREHHGLDSGRSIAVAGFETFRDRGMVGFSFVG